MPRVPYAEAIGRVEGSVASTGGSEGGVVWRRLVRKEKECKNKEKRKSQQSQVYGV